MKTKNGSVSESPVRPDGINRRSKSATKTKQVLVSPRNPDSRALINTKALLIALDAFERGDFSVRLPLDWGGTAGKVADRFNRVVALNERMAKELSRLRHLVGREGRIHQHASLGEVGGKWAESVDLINDLIADLVQPTSEMARVIGGVATGDLSQTM